MSAPVVDPARTSRRPAAVRAPGWLAGVTLVVGLVAVALYALASGVSLVAQHHIHAGAAGLHEVAKTYVPGWTSPDYDPFADGRLRAITPLLTVVYMSATTALGSVLVRSMRGSAEWPRAVRLLAGFLPGYLMLLGPLQLLFAAVPLVPAAWLALAAVTAAAAAVRGRDAVAATRRLRDDASGRRALLISGGIVFGLLALAGLHRIQMGLNFMVTDSITAFLVAANDQLAGGYGSHLVQWDQQSDEWIFSAPLMFTAHTARDYLLPLYATQFVGLASFGCLTFGVVHSLAGRARRLSAALATAAVLVSTPAIFPWFYAPLVGGHNPVLWLGHPGRYVAIAAPWVALLLLGRHGRGALAAIGLATVGLGFVTLHATAYVLVVLVAALGWTALRGRPASARIRRHAPLPIAILAVAALGAPILVFCLVHAVADPSALAWVLVAGVVGATLAAVLVGLTAADRPAVGPRWGRIAGWSLAWLAALGAGVVLSNNFLDGLHLRTLLGHVLPGFQTPLASRDLGGDDLTAGLTFPTFAGDECTLATGSCANAAAFVADWGFLTVLALATWIALGRAAAGASASAGLVTQGRRAAWLLMVAALCASFLLVDFTGASLLVAWILTRFYEVPYYGLLGLAAITFAGTRNRVTKWAGLGVLAAWSVVPIVVNLVPLQLVENGQWLARAIFPG